MKNYQITNWCHHFIAEHVVTGDLCIDATAGNGYDTELLCRLVGNSGHVLAFDIQAAAITSTRNRLQAAHLDERVTLITDSHANMEQYAKKESISCIVFNLGYLPSGDHSIATHAGSTIKALQASLELLRKGGLISLCIYSGGDSGFEERDTVLSYIKALDSKKYLVILSQYYNRPNHPPIPVLIHKL